MSDKIKKSEWSKWGPGRQRAFGRAGRLEDWVEVRPGEEAAPAPAPEPAKEEKPKEEAKTKRTR